MQSRLIHIISILSVLFSFCAQPVTPTGGDKDNTPPQLLKTIPLNNTTNFQGKIIEFFFDENVTFKTPEKLIVISPVPTVNPRIIKSNKSIKIYFNDTLIPRTTYSISLNSTVSDLNENNRGIYDPLLFTTGNHIDTNQIHGSIQAWDGIKLKNLKLFCIDTTKTNTTHTALVEEEKFSIYGLDSAIKKIIIFNDENNNNKPDTLEALSVSFCNPRPTKDSVLFKMYNTTKPVITILQDSVQSALYGINTRVFTTNNTLSGYSLVKDTLFFKSERLHEFLSLLPQQQYKLVYKKEPLDSLIKYTTNTATTDSSFYINLSFSKSIKYLNKTSIDLYGFNDTTTIDSGLINLDGNNVYIGPITTSNPQRILIPANNIQFHAFSPNKDFSIKLEKPKNSIIIFNNTDSIAYSGILKANNITIDLFLGPTSQESIPVPQGTWECLFWQDINHDNLITPPTMEPFQAGEPYFIQKNIISTPSLTNEIIIPNPYWE